MSEIIKNRCKFALCSLMTCLKNYPMDIIKYIIELQLKISQIELHKTQRGFTVYNGKSLVFDSPEHCEYYKLERDNYLHTSPINDDLITTFTFDDHYCAITLNNGLLKITDYFSRHPFNPTDELSTVNVLNVTKFALVGTVLFAVTDDGKLYYIGNTPSTTIMFDCPRLVDLSEKVKLITSSSNRLVIIAESGSVYTIQPHLDMEPILINSDAVQGEIVGTCCADNMIIVYTNTSNIYLYGFDWYKLIDSKIKLYNVLTKLPVTIGNMDIQKICCSDTNIFFVLTNYETYVVGSNYNYQTASNDDDRELRRTFIGSKVVEIACHDKRTMIITLDGSVYLCGNSLDDTEDLPLTKVTTV